MMWLETDNSIIINLYFKSVIDMDNSDASNIDMHQDSDENLEGLL